MRTPIESPLNHQGSRETEASEREKIMAKQAAMPSLETMMDYLKINGNTLDRHSESQIATFYTGRSIFITGASGFVGKVSSVKD